MLLDCDAGEDSRVHWTARKSNQSILKEVNPEYSLAGLMMKLKLQYFGHLIWRADSLEKTLMLETVEDRKRRGWQRMRWLDGITDLMDMSLSKFGEIVKDREALYAAAQGVTKSQTQLSNWTTTGGLEMQMQKPKFQKSYKKTEPICPTFLGNRVLWVQILCSPHNGCVTLYV